jgi:hypothetical protein
LPSKGRWKSAAVNELGKLIWPSDTASLLPIKPSLNCNCNAEENVSEDCYTQNLSDAAGFLKALTKTNQWRGAATKIGPARQTCMRCAVRSTPISDLRPVGILHSNLAAFVVLADAFSSKLLCLCDLLCCHLFCDCVSAFFCIFIPKRRRDICPHMRIPSPNIMCGSIFINDQK